MPKMGESIMEATILKWLKKEGDAVEMDESILEIATDKVDSEIPAPEAGIMGEMLFQEGDVVEVGKVIAYIHTEGSASEPSKTSSPKAEPAAMPEPVAVAVEEKLMAPIAQNGGHSNGTASNNSNGRFYSPLVLNIARKENISMNVLESLAGSGKDGRVTKKDILAFVKSGASIPSPTTTVSAPVSRSVSAGPSVAEVPASPKFEHGANVEIEQMDRMRKLIADHMVMSKRTSPHVTSFVEADVTNMVNWRNKVKGEFLKKHGQKITFTPLFVEAVVKAIGDFPKINSSVDGYNWILKKNVNVGIATALPSGNLIVPVIKDANHKSLLGITSSANELIAKARANKLAPTDIQGGTFTVTNVGTFGNLSGTPIINQPQVAILATGSIIKKPAVLETEHGDVIAIRQMMYMSLSYDHRVVDGFLGGSFLRKVADYLEQFDDTRTI